MARISLRVDLDAVEDALRELGPSFQARLLGPSLAASARVVRNAARKTTAFQDRTGRLRRSIRVGRIAARYGGKRFRTGRAAVFAGGVRERAQHAHLVERGHDGPQAAPPHEFLLPALLTTQGAQAVAFVTTAKRLLPRLVQRDLKRGRRSIRRGRR